MSSFDTRSILQWAWDRFGDQVAMSSSFQVQSLPLLHMVSQTVPALPILFLDTGFHFPETLAFRDKLAEDWGLNIRVLRAEPNLSQPSELYRQDPDLCCYVNKVAPMQTALQDYSAWISGIRRDQSANRAAIKVVEEVNEVVRIHPMADWSSKDIWRYIHDQNLPAHPLLSQGYMSIGCAPCTQPIFDAENERAGRWAGQTKTECGLHTTLRQAETNDMDVVTPYNP